MKKLLKFFLIFFPIIIFTLFFVQAARANSQGCYALFHPIDSNVASVKAQGGVWEAFEKRSHFRDHSTVALHLDQKAISLIYTLDYICQSMDRIPRNDVSNYILPMWRERGEEAFIKYQTEGYGYAIEEVMTWVEYAKYFEKNYLRKLDFALVQETMKKSEKFVDRFVEIVRKVRKTNKVKEVVAESKILIADFAKFHKEDPVLKQADAENAAIPYASTLTESSDEM
jgi:hemerythrin